MRDTIFADLHNHTTASDGDFTPDGLVDQAKKRGIQVLGITDHDTLAGLDAAVASGEKAGIEVVPGVEVSVRFNRPDFTGTLHVLAYFPRQRLGDKAFCRRFQTVLAGGRGEGLVRARIDKINGVFGPGGATPLLARPLVFEDISAYSANASRRHFAMALSRDFGITDKNVVNRIIGNQSPAYLPSGVDLDQVVQFLKNEPVIGVLAHPAAGSFPGEGHYREVLPPLETVRILLPELLAAGVKGLEVYYPGHTRAHQDLLLEWAGDHGLLVTGGSDCHDAVDRPPGVCGLTAHDYSKFKAAVLGLEGRS